MAKCRKCQAQALSGLVCQAMPVAPKLLNDSVRAWWPRVLWLYYAV